MRGRHRGGINVIAVFIGFTARVYVCAYSWVCTPQVPHEASTTRRKCCDESGRYRANGTSVRRALRRAAWEIISAKLSAKLQTRARVEDWKLTSWKD